MRCLTSNHWPDTLRVAVKASSYSEAVCVYFIPVVSITTTVSLLLELGAIGIKKISRQSKICDFFANKIQCMKRSKRLHM